ncbi:MAG: SMI1/KNR4 family protein [Saezia sp.]
MIRAVEQQYGYKLPASYIALLQSKNGGSPFNLCFPTKEATGWADDHIMLYALMGIDSDNQNSVLGPCGQDLWIEEWGYPDINLYIGETQSAGHQMVALDYRKCGKQCENGEPSVVYIDEEDGYSIVLLAETFENFIRGLVHSDFFEDDF